MPNKLPYLTTIIAMSIDGKISEATDIPARFSSKEDLAHLETQISLLDAIIFGGNTLRAYGTSLVIKNPQLLKQRQDKKQSLQPLNIVCSASGNINPDLRFFSQPLPRGLLTSSQGLLHWQEKVKDFNKKNNLKQDNYFQDFFVADNPFNWREILTKLSGLNYNKIGILGGSKLISFLLAENLINELWITICPLIIRNKLASSFLDSDILANINLPINLKLLEVKVINQEVFLHYLILNHDQ
ncbi:5-amino-6-(5-phosphoribosylamino)uracil reductase [Geminocystis sp. NIES-3708]|uniref:RibD family protein n=1 Tax=Geminocystis sp. NIES-3708 TaxID=1615909 RepID=UPI0005FCCDBE|nr:RibD family protein [Geminocystis sp. NIES-3708]BAQ60876.1 5-amino-6-(5-phosphoribosylamino)uracil reductase [Geminocystis sp. NIES-3708]